MEIYLCQLFCLSEMCSQDRHPVTRGMPIDILKQNIKQIDKFKQILPFIFGSFTV